MWVWARLGRVLATRADRSCYQTAANMVVEKYIAMGRVERKLADVELESSSRHQRSYGSRHLLSSTSSGSARLMPWCSGVLPGLDLLVGLLMADSSGCWAWYCFGVRIVERCCGSASTEKRLAVRSVLVLPGVVCCDGDMGLCGGQVACLSGLGARRWWRVYPGTSVLKHVGGCLDLAGVLLGQWGGVQGAGPGLVASSCLVRLPSKLRANVWVLVLVGWSPCKLCICLCCRGLGQPCAWCLVADNHGQQFGEDVRERTSYTQRWCRIVGEPTALQSSFGLVLYASHVASSQAQR